MTALNKYAGLNLEFAYNASARLDNDLLRTIISPLVVIPKMHYTNCCWVNVCLAVARIFDVKFSEKSTMDVLSTIIKMDSKIASPIDISDAMKDLRLPVTIIEYCAKNKIGHSIGSPNGPIVALVNVGNHYQIWLTHNSDVRGLFTVLSTEQTSHTSKTKRRRNRKSKFTAIKYEVPFENTSIPKSCWDNLQTTNPYSS